MACGCTIAHVAGVAGTSTHAGVSVAHLAECGVLGLMTIDPGMVPRRVPAIAIIAGHGDPLLAIP